MEQTKDMDEVAFSKLQIGQSDLKEELIEAMKSLIPPPQVTETPGEVTENDTSGEELLELEKRLQKEEENMNYMTKYMWDSLAKGKRVIQTQTA